MRRAEKGASGKVSLGFFSAFPPLALPLTVKSDHWGEGSTQSAGDLALASANKLISLSAAGRSPATAAAAVNPSSFNRHIRTLQTIAYGRSNPATSCPNAANEDSYFARSAK